MVSNSCFQLSVAVVPPCPLFSSLSPFQKSLYVCCCSAQSIVVHTFSSWRNTLDMLFAVCLWCAGTLFFNVIIFRKLYHYCWMCNGLYCKTAREARGSSFRHFRRALCQPFGLVIAVQLISFLYFLCFSGTFFPHSYPLALINI